MTIKLYNTLTRTKEPFEPIDPANVRLYVCGPTVYDYAHIGNARPIIVFDVLYRLLRHEFGDEHVTYVRNITDVDDKINARAAAEGVSIGEVTERTILQFHEDIAALGVLLPTVEPRATDHIEEMKALCETLVANGHAYVAQDHVLFDVPSMPDYGKLSNRTLDEMKAGARVEVADYKKDPSDFVLWKPSKDGEPAWPSPCKIATSGRPGWHLECSAMADKWLWQEAKPTLSDAGLARPHVFDIHGGGIDLQFPHHENEIAQSRCAHGTAAMANVWMHNGFLQVEGEKMSKSLGNFITINELLETDKFGGKSWPGDVLRIAMLRTHYRQPINWTIEMLQENLKAWVSFGNVIRDVSEADSHDEEFISALCDDLNTPAAFARLFELRDAGAAGDSESARKLRKACNFVGLFSQWSFGEEITVNVSAGVWDLCDIIPRILAVNADYDLVAAADHFEKNHLNDSSIVVQFLRKFAPGTCVRDLRKLGANWDCLIDLDHKRAAARADKNWAEGDRIRDELAVMGVQLKDSKDPDTGEIKTTWAMKR